MAKDLTLYQSDGKKRQKISFQFLTGNRLEIEGIVKVTGAGEWLLIDTDQGAFYQVQTAKALFIKTTEYTPEPR